MTPSHTKRMSLVIILICITLNCFAQPGAIKWSPDGNSYYRIESNEVNQYVLPASTKTTYRRYNDF